MKHSEDKKQDDINEKTRLRLRAEEIARETLADLPVHPEAIPPEEVMRTLNELQVHQIELQMQNDELRRTQSELETLKSRYFDLFDLAPVGYCTISCEGQILESNLTACNLLGITRAELIEKPFSRFILPQDSDIFYLLIQKLSDTATAQERELRLVRKGGVVFWAHLTVTAIVETDAPMVYRVVLSDITPLKQKEGALQEANRELQWNQQKLEVLFNLLPVGISVLDQDSKIIKQNQALENILDINKNGLDAKAYTGRKYIRTDGTPMPAEEFPSSRVMAGESLVENIRIGVLKEDGSLVWTRVSAAAGPLPDWKVAIATSDITAVVQAEMEVKDSEEKYRILFDNDLYAVAIVDLEDNHLLEVNQTFANLTGYSTEALIGGMTIDKLSVETEETRAAISEVKEKGSIFIPHCRLRKKDGGVITVEIAVNIAILKGKMVSYTILHDISDRIAAENRVRFQATLLDNTGEAVCAIGSDGKFIYWNTAAENLFGYKAEEMIGQDNGFLKKNPNSIDTVAHITQSMNEGKTWSGELIVKRKDGDAIDLRLSANPISAVEGQPDYIVCVMQDITERKALREKLNAARRMAGIVTLAAGMAHELNSPLQVITGTCESTLNRIRSGSQDMGKLESKLETISSQAWRCAAIVRSLLDYTAPVRDEVTQQDLNQLVREALPILESQPIQVNRVSIQLSLAEGLPSLECNRVKTLQMLEILLDNAIAELKGGGQVSVRSGFNPETLELWVQVADTGPGVPKDLREKIFEPFFTTKEQGQGKGLGLFVLHNTLVSMGGRVSVEDALPHGAVFTIYFPDKYVRAAPEEANTRGKYATE